MRRPLVITTREALLLALAAVLGIGTIGAAIGRVTGPEHAMTVGEYEALICAPIPHDALPKPARKEIDL